MGLDPGLVATGFGVIEAAPGVVTVIESGVITTASTQPLEARLNAIYGAVRRLIEAQRPSFLVVEEVQPGSLTCAPPTAHSTRRCADALWGCEH